MNSLFFAKMARSNLKKNAKTYLPFMLACIGTVMMFYMMCIIALNPGLQKMSGGDSLQVIFNLGIFVIAFFALVFLFYTNSFLVKQREKEFGLLNLLGMEKRHIAMMVLFETIYTIIICLTLGLLGGILFSKLMFMLLLKILQFSIPVVFIISKEALVYSVILFGVLFFAMYLNTIRQIHLAKPVDLLKGGQVGEKEPKTKWLLLLVGLLSLGGGYYIAVTTSNPIAALQLFFVAVMLVIIGTYCLFVAGSIALLKLLRQNKRYYYQTKHFISVSGMMYRMKQHAVGLANICILSTMVLVMVSTTVSLYIGMEDVLRTRYPRNVMIESTDMSDEYMTGIYQQASKILTNHDLKPENVVQYRFISLSTLYQNNEFTLDTSYTSMADMRTLFFLTLDDYNLLAKTNHVLGENEILISSNRLDYVGDELRFLDFKFDVIGEMEVKIEDGNAASFISNTHFIVVANMDIFQAIHEAQTKAYGDYHSIPRSYLGFDIDLDMKDQLIVINVLEEMLVKEYPTSFVESPARSKESFFAIYGGLFFLGIFLGMLFMMATILIIYYKQISEGYDDRDRFVIMQKVGLRKEEVKQTIQSQILMVFFAPLGAAVIHILFAFPVMTRLLQLLSLTNTRLFAYGTLGTIAVFGFFYFVIYQLTAREYYRIVEN